MRLPPLGRRSAPGGRTRRARRQMPRDGVAAAAAAGAGAGGAASAATVGGPGPPAATSAPLRDRVAPADRRRTAGSRAGIGRLRGAPGSARPSSSAEPVGRRRRAACRRTGSWSAAASGSPIMAPPTTPVAAQRERGVAAAGRVGEAQHLGAVVGQRGWVADRRRGRRRAALSRVTARVPPVPGGRVGAGEQVGEHGGLLPAPAAPGRASVPGCWAQSPIACTRSSEVASRSSTSMPRSTAIPASAARPVSARTPAATTSASAGDQLAVGGAQPGTRLPRRRPASRAGRRRRGRSSVAASTAPARRVELALHQVRTGCTTVTRTPRPASPRAASQPSSPPPSTAKRAPGRASGEDARAVVEVAERGDRSAVRSSPASGGTRRGCRWRAPARRSARPAVVGSARPGRRGRSTVTATPVRRSTPVPRGPARAGAARRPRRQPAGQHGGQQHPVVGRRGSAPSTVSRTRGRSGRGGAPPRRTGHRPSRAPPPRPVCSRRSTVGSRRYAPWGRR